MENEVFQDSETIFVLEKLGATLWMNNRANDSCRYFHKGDKIVLGCIYTAVSCQYIHLTLYVSFLMV